MSGWLPGFTTFGAIVGLLTGVFTLWDRLLRARPIAYLASGSNDVALRITNPGDDSMFILSIELTPPNVYFLSRGDDIHTIVEDQLSDITNWLIEPKGTAEFPIRERFEDGKKVSRTDQRISFSVSWRRGSGTWLPQFPVTVRTKTSIVNEIRNATISRAA